MEINRKMDIKFGDRFSNIKEKELCYFDLLNADRKIKKKFDDGFFSVTKMKRK